MLLQSSKTDPTLDPESVIEHVLGCPGLSEAEQFFIVQRLRAPWQRRLARKADRYSLIADLGAQIGGTLKAQAEKIASGLRRPLSSPHRAPLEQILALSRGLPLSPETIRQILSDRA